LLLLLLLLLQIVEAFGGKGYFVSSPSDLLPMLKEALAQTVCECWST
jgi:hypothetical protein